MTRYLLDTNIINDAVKPAPSPKLAQWMQAQKDADLHIAATAQANQCIVVTANERDFRTVPFFNPMAN